MTLKKIMRFASVGIVCGYLLTTLAYAASKPQGAINIEADRGSFDLKAKAHHFEGKVQLKQADFSVEADQAWVEGDAGHQKVRAVGSPVLVLWPSEGIKASAQKVEYQQATGELRLNGKVHLDQKGNLLDSESLRYSLITRAVIADGGNASSPSKGRVRMRWLPEGDSSSSQPAPSSAPEVKPSSGAL
ncbi:MAG: lipopolysaccharide transport periplasmic protein LptA [Pseudomonadota bacterium]